jgi:hypothetical protein
MKKQFYLPGLNSKPERKKDSKPERKKDPNLELQKLVDEMDCKKNFLLYKFVNTPNDYYIENFGELERCKQREKRLLEFETPNRAKITHEYDIKLERGFKFGGYHYLFNPTNRLSWLKIRQDGNRITIASNDEIKELVKTKLNQELDKYGNKEALFDYIWKNKKGYPCFIKLEKSNRKHILLETEYFDSVKKDDTNPNKNYIGIFSPFDERSISYEYEPLNGHSSWLYVRSPKKFNVSVKVNNINNSVNDIEFHEEIESDPEISTLTIINKQNSPNSNVKMNIEIAIPPSLKNWFQTIYVCSISLIILLIAHILNKIYLFLPLWISDITVSSIVDIRIVLALVAGIITTRGWLISEETILKRYSIYLTRILVLLIVLSIISLIIT